MIAFKRNQPDDEARRFYLGWPAPRRTPPRVGFAADRAEPAPETERRDDIGRAASYRGDSHYLCVAPTGSGKTRGVVIPNLLMTTATCVVLDVKGELYHVTAERRRRMGRVIVLDAFNLTGSRQRDGLNPLDQFALGVCDVESDSQMMAQNLSCGFEFNTDPFWNTMGTSLGSAIISHLVTGAKPEEKNLNALVSHLFSDDVVYNLAVLLDSGTVTSETARRKIAATLQLPEKTRESVIATAQSYVAALQSEGIQKALAASSFDLRDFARGEPMTIYICIPPTKLASHASLLRLWIGTLLTAVCSRETLPDRPTWFFIDEAAQLGGWQQLEQVLTLLRGYGVQAATFWQDLSQLKNLYPRSWSTIISNSECVQVFGVTKHSSAEALAEVFGNQPDDLLRLEPHETLVLNGDELRVCQKLDYLHDPCFAGKYRPNPRFTGRGKE